MSALWLLQSVALGELLMCSLVEPLVCILIVLIRLGQDLFLLLLVL